MRIEVLEWDSKFFGLRIGRAIVASAEEGEALKNEKEALRRKFDLIYVFASCDTCFSAPNAKLIDKKVVYVKSDAEFSEPNRHIVQWDTVWGVTDDLLHLALLSGEYSRFKLDQGFPSGSYERLYSRWIEQSVNHSLASKVFCYMVEGVPRGLVTLNDRDDSGSIGLVAIHEDFRYRGIGTSMIRQVISQIHLSHRQKLFVTTQGANAPACRLYEKCGFQVDSVTDIWHWWL